MGGLAGAAMLLESSLTRLLAISQFYHFAFLVVSLALLGFGASGSLLSLLPKQFGIEAQASNRYALLETKLAWYGLFFSMSLGISYLLVNYLPFNSYTIAFDPRQIVLFCLYYLALALPFLVAGIGIGVALQISQANSHRVYAANLLGSAIGVVAGLVMMALVGLPGALILCAIIGIAISLGLSKHWQQLTRIALGLTIVVGVLTIAWLGVLNKRGMSPLGLRLSPYKGLSYVRQYPGARWVFGAWNAFSRLDVLEQAGTRMLPGLSYTYIGDPPPQQGYAIDADSPQPVSLVAPDDFTAAQYLPEAIAYQIKPGARVLILSAGGGLPILQALSGGANQVSVILDNPLIPRAMQQTAPEYDPFAAPRVNVIPTTFRSGLARLKSQYDVITLPLTEVYHPVSSGAYSLSETYQLTVEAFEAMLERLDPQGVLVASRWVQTPPSEELRLLSTFSTALQNLGYSAPKNYLIAFRGIQTFTLLVKLAPWTPEELASLRQFTELRRFDLVWAPDLQPGETNRFNQLPDSTYDSIVPALLEPPQSQSAIDNYEFAIDPVHDERPFFFHFFTWKQIPTVLSSFGRIWQPFGGSGYLILLALLGLVCLFSLVLIMLPVLMNKHRSFSQPAFQHGSYTPANWVVVLYFSCLGIAFLFIEIPLIQRFMLIFGQPIFAFTFVVGGLLVFSSLGSLMAPWRKWPVKYLFVILIIAAVSIPLLLHSLGGAILGLPVPYQALISLSGVAVLSFLMGIPFPLGLAWLEGQHPRQIAWAWAINGCASVIAAVLAAILALSYGFMLVLLLGAGMYLVAGLVLSSQWNKRDTTEVRGA